MPVEQGPSIYRKTPQELVNQAVSNSKYIEKLTGQPLISPVIKDISILGSLNENEAKVQFGTQRYGFLTDFMRSDLTGRELSKETIKNITHKLQFLNRLETYIDNFYSDPENRTLYPEQIKAVEAIADYVKNGGQNGYLRLPTAFGKTVVIAELAKTLGFKTLVVVPGIETVDQTQETFAQFAPETPAGKVYEFEQNFDEPVTVITYDSLISHLQHKEWEPEEEDLHPDDYELVIFDEAHHVLGRRTQWAIDQFPDAFKFGFTATPKYSTDRHVGQVLDTEIYGVTIEDAVKKGLLCDFRVWLARTNTDLSKVHIDAESGDYNQKQLALALNTDPRNRAIAEFYIKEFVGESLISYCSSVKHAKDQAEMFKAYGIRAAAVWGKMNRDERRKVVEQFKNGEIDVLCNMKALREGVDLPNASVIFTTSTMSVVNEEQEGGRGLRIDKNNPNKFTTIVDFIDRDHRKGRQRVTFADVAGKAIVTKNPERETEVKQIVERKPRTLTTKTEKVLSDDSVVDIELITEVEEIMSITASGREERESINRVPDGFFVLVTPDLAKEYGVDAPSISTLVYSLSEQYPDQFNRRGKGRFSLVTEQGLELLRRAITQIVVPENFNPLNTVDLQAASGANAQAVSRAIERLSKNQPSLVIRRGRNRRVLITQEGYDLVLQDLAIKVSGDYVTINTPNFASEFNISSSHFNNKMRALSEAHPDEIIRNFRQPYRATARGIELIREELNKLRPQGEYQKLDVEALAKEYSVHPTTIHNYVKRVNEISSTDVVKGGRNKPVYVTSKGLMLLRRNLSERSSSSLSPTERTIYLKPQADQNEMTKLAQRLSFGTTSSEYGSDLWKKRASRYLSAQRKTANLDIDQIAAQMNCDVSDVSKLEEGELSLAEFQGDLPRRYAEAIGNPGVYNLYNLMFHLEFGVDLANAA